MFLCSLAATENWNRKGLWLLLANLGMSDTTKHSVVCLRIWLLSNRRLTNPCLLYVTIRFLPESSMHPFMAACWVLLTYMRGFFSSLDWVSSWTLFHLVGSNCGNQNVSHACVLYDNINEKLIERCRQTLEEIQFGAFTWLCSRPNFLRCEAANQKNKVTPVVTSWDIFCCHNCGLRAETSENFLPRRTL